MQSYNLAQMQKIQAGWNLVAIRKTAGRPGMHRGPQASAKQGSLHFVARLLTPKLYRQPR